MTTDSTRRSAREVRWLRPSRQVAILRCLVSFLGICFLSPATLSHAQHAVMTRHVHQEVTDGRAPLVGVLPRSQPMSLAIVLPIRDQEGLDRQLEQIYDQKSPAFHQYLSIEQFTDRFGPTPEDYEAVVQFAKANGMTVTDTPINRRLVEVTGTVANVENAFRITMGLYRHPTEARTFFSPDREPMVDLAQPVWHISGLDNYSVPRPLYLKGKSESGVRNTTGSGPDGDFLGSDRRAAYYGGTTLTGAGQAVGLVEFDGYAVSDVQAYFKNVGQTLGVPINNVLLDGASAGSDGDDTEQVIDIIEAISMAPGLSQVRVYIAPLSTVFTGGDTFIFNKMASENIAKQLSGSWNWSPADPTTDDPIFEQFAAQGQTFVTASGDDGSWPNQPYYFPEEDANVTAVGGTDLTTNGPGGSWESEIAWSGSGGGISPDHVAIPSYQQLPGVINSSNKGSTVYRNAPDVAAEANTDNYYCANGSCGEGLGGTSLAAPTWAGFIALVNQENIDNGKTTEGFLNPTIYPIGVSSSYGSYFHDITSGSNGTYSAVPGYDLVTGWGSPNPTDWITPPVPTNWPMFGFSAASNRYNPFETVIGTSTVGSLIGSWSLTLRSYYFGGSPVVANGVLYMAAGNDILYALNAKTGAEVWTLTKSGGFGRPVVANGVLYVISNATLYALNASTGAQLWTWAGNGADAIPVVSGGIVYAASTNNDLYALNATTGAELWAFSAGTIVSWAAVANGLLYLGGSTALYALNASTGAETWTVAGLSSPVVANGVVYAMSSAGTIYALNATTGAQLWSFAGDADTPVVVANGVLYFETEATLYALNANTGAELWSFNTGDMGVVQAVANGVVYTGGYTALYALNASTGAKLATFTTEGLLTSPTIVNGVLYFAGDSGLHAGYGTLYAYAP
jgi:outer membrane protein assembly factor BamB